MAEAKAPPFHDPGGFIACPPGTKNCGFKFRPAWYLRLDFFKTLTVADDEGHRDTFPVTEMLLQTVTSVSYVNECPKDNCMMVIMSVDRTYELTFTPEWDFLLELVKGVGNTCPDEAIRYLGPLFPEGTTARLRITPRGVEDLRYNTSGNGNFSFSIKPTSHTLAPAAWDTDGPSLKFAEQAQDANTVLVIISAQDESGVKTVMYAIDDGPPQVYQKPIRLTRGRVHNIMAFADDTLGNRGNSYEYATKK